MITRKKLKIYKRYSGDIDHYQRTGHLFTRNLIGDKDWMVIDDLIQDLRMIDKKIVSVNFEQVTLSKISETVDKSAVDLLYALAKDPGI